ncbi:MAG: hypothetical protein R2764_23550 [Bacteroidales bacterium]
MLLNHLRMGAEIGELLTGAYAFPTTGFNDQLKAIIMQKWVDAADGGRGIDRTLNVSELVTLKNQQLAIKLQKATNFRVIIFRVL